MEFPGILSQCKSLTYIQVIDFGNLIADSSKLRELDRILKEKKKNGDKVLIFCQMTKMIDILEDFMNLRKYTFFRLDGASNIADRRDMVNDFQKPQSKVFVFLLSTRAGIFYNLHRWTGCNPDCSQYSHLLRQRLEPHYGCSSNRQSSQNRPEQRRERLSVGHEGDRKSVV